MEIWYKVFNLKRHENTTWVNTMTSFESFKASEKKGTIKIQIYQYAVVKPCLNTKHTNCNKHALLCLEE